jgi:dTDP-4-amino-4,6-dideoxygalactose transaminase
VTRAYDDLELGYIKEVLAARKLGWRQGGMVTRFEEAFGEFVGSRFAIARGSGTAALAQVLSLSGVGTGTEVICDPLLHFGGLAALYCHATPRFADVRAGTFNIDPASVRANITSRTRALVVTNLWGLCAELDELRQICDQHDLVLVEDCAQAIDSYWQGKHAGTFGDWGVFSLQHHKQLSTGEGGMIVTNRADLHARVVGPEALECVVPDSVTFNFRMNEPTAAIGLGQLQKVRGYVQSYNRNLTIMGEAIADCAWLQPRQLPTAARQSGHTWACVWEGDKLGLDYQRFQQTCEKLHLPIWFGVNGCDRPAYSHSLFQEALAWQKADCAKAQTAGATHGDPASGVVAPVAESLIPRLLTVDVVEMPERLVRRTAANLREAIRRLEVRRSPQIYNG